MSDEGLRSPAFNELYSKVYDAFAEARRKGVKLDSAIGHVLRFELGFGELTYREHKEHHCIGCACAAPAKGDGE